MGDFNSSQIDGDSTAIKGATDQTHIGNVGDALKVALANSSTTQVTSENELATFSICGFSTTTALDKSMLSIMNATGSGVIIKIREIRIINMKNSAVTGVVADFRLLRCTGHSSGSSLTPTSFDTSDSLNANVTVKYGATITGEGTGCLRHWEWSTDEWNPGAPDVESADHALQLLIPGYAPLAKTKPITMRPGEGVTLKQIINTTTGTFDIMFLITQETL